MRITYLDNNATTRVDERVIAAMLPYFGETYGNPSSTHHFGAQVMAAIEEARAQVARLIGARDGEIVFTSGGTEADNAALRGVIGAKPNKRHIIICATEHSAILDTASVLEKQGVSVTRIGVDGEGRVDPAVVAAAMRDDTALISIMLANNETGVIAPLRDICQNAQERGVLVHTDAVNALGKKPINVDDLGVALLSLSGHKIHAPKGVGALYIRRGTPFVPMQVGGHQERDRRGGTYNAPGIIALGAACEILREEGERYRTHAGQLRDQLESRLRERFADVKVLGAHADRVSNTSCVCFPGVGAEAVLLLLSENGICASSGAACSSGSLEPSHVLTAMGIEPFVAQGQLRFSVGRFNTEADVDRLMEVLPSAIEKVAAVNAPA